MQQRKLMTPRKIRLTADLDAALRSLSRFEGESVNAIIRKLLREQLRLLQNSGHTAEPDLSGGLRLRCQRLRLLQNSGHTAEPLLALLGVADVTPPVRASGEPICQRQQR